MGARDHDDTDMTPGEFEQAVQNAVPADVTNAGGLAQLDRDMSRRLSTGSTGVPRRHSRQQGPADEHFEPVQALDGGKA